MNIRAGIRAVLGLCALIVSASLLSCSSAAVTSGSFVGQADGSESFVAIVTDGDKVMAYVCDSDTTATWFTAEGIRDTIDLMSADNVGLVAQRGEGDTLDGTLTQGAGSEFSFSATRVDMDGTLGGLCRADPRVINGVTYVGGWIVLPDGTQRGAVVGDNGERIFGVLIDPETMIAEVPGLGTFQARVVLPADL